MHPIEYNLLDEPWICVVGTDCASAQVSLTDALVNAHSYADLSGELPTQDIAILRLLLAVLHTVFSRVDENGDDAPIENVGDALRRWQSLWRRGCFPEAPIREYLEQWRDRFWLFHPERPFYQVNAAEIGTAYTSAKLNGELSESGNKVKLFPTRSGKTKENLSYAEAARWLIYLNAFDDTALKKKGSSPHSLGIGWLGKLGLIQAVGQNLYETLMLNLVLLNNRELWPEENRPVWELDTPRTQQLNEISIPENQAELLTLQSRRILLIRDKQRVTGCKVLGGDFFSAENSIAEQMTLWDFRQDKKEIDSPYFLPKKYTSDRFIWQEFNTIIAGDDHRKPGIITWLSLLQRAPILPKEQIVTFRILQNQYDLITAAHAILDTFADELVLHANLFSELGEAWQAMIKNEVALCAKCADCVGKLALDLNRAAGDNKRPQDRKSAGDKQGDPVLIAKSRFFAEIDIPFREWLAGLDANASPETMRASSRSWHVRIREIVLRIGKEMIALTGNTAFIGHTVMEERKGKKERIPIHYSSPKAWNIFQGMVRKIYSEE